jgi:3D (Asp-Asp-Asp) domain-containing protein
MLRQKPCLPCALRFRRPGHRLNHANRQLAPQENPVSASPAHRWLPWQRWSAASLLGVAALAMAPLTAHAASPASVSGGAATHVSRLKAEMRHHPAMRQVLRLGSHGHWVMTLQADLALAGFTQVGGADGWFGPRTRAALAAFQRSAGLRPSGVANPRTWQALLIRLGVLPGNAAKSRGAATSPSQASQGATPNAYPFGGNAAAGVGGTIDGHQIVAVYHMRATAYGPSANDNYPYGPVDYFGQPLQPGMVAVDPSVIPLKSLVYVTGYHDPNLPAGGFLGRAMDTGGAIKGKRIDIYMDAGPRAVSNFGIEPVTVYVLAP